MPDRTVSPERAVLVDRCLERNEQLVAAGVKLGLVN
jgi:hypothetical protein